MTQSVLLFDMQAPGIGTPAAKLYPAMLEMARFADKAGFDAVSVAEHHGTETGYLPSPFTVGGALAAVTERIKIMLTCVVLPLHDPVSIAEDIAVLDLISQGRLEVVFGAGYVPSEFALFRVPMNQRARLLEDGVDLIVKALKGDRFEAGGREIFISPLPYQRPHPPFYIGTSVEAGALRAAKRGFGLAPMVSPTKKSDLSSIYDRECRALGREPGPKLAFGNPINVYVAEDPEAAWAKVGPHIVNHASTYIRFASQSLAAGSAPGSHYAEIDPVQIRQSGAHRIVTPDECVALAAELAAIHMPLRLQPLVGGLAPEEGWKSLELFAKAVLPRLASA